MKRYVLALALIFSGFAGFSQFNNNYYFSPNTHPNYSDLTTVKATALVNSDEIMTVGYAREAGSNFRHDIIIMKTKSSNGSVIWAKSYGLEDLDEKGYGLTVSYDKRHIIVAGTAQDKDNPTDWNALAMKINISTGNVVWSTQLGKVGEYQEFRMVERTYPGPFLPLLTTYTLVGFSSLENQVKAVIYAAAVSDFNGAQIWANLYLEANTFPKVTDLSFNMVRNPENNFIISGTRYVDQKPSDIFTVGINPFTGALSDKYIRYDVEEKDHYEGSICTVKIDDFNGYGLAFTTRDPNVDLGVGEAITVMLLDKERTPINTNHYWQPGHSVNRGLSIYQSTVQIKTFDVYTNTVRTTNNPGFLNVDVDGPENYFLKYNKQEVANNKYPTAMVQAKFGYTAKALHRNGENGFLLARLNPDGKTECAKEEDIKRDKREAKFETRDYSDFDYGDDKKRDIKVKEVHGKMEKCDGTGGTSFKYAVAEAAEETEATSFEVYPNPVSANETNFTLNYQVAASQAVEIEVYNTLGQRIYVSKTTLTGGANQLLIDANNLSVGINLVIISNEGGVLHQAKVMKQ